MATVDGLQPVLKGSVGTGTSLSRLGFDDFEGGFMGAATRGVNFEGVGGFRFKAVHSQLPQLSGVCPGFAGSKAGILVILLVHDDGSDVFPALGVRALVDGGRIKPCPFWPRLVCWLVDSPGRRREDVGRGPVSNQQCVSHKPLAWSNSDRFPVCSLTFGCSCWSTCSGGGRLIHRAENGLPNAQPVN